MAEDSGGRKKALLVLVLTFLFAGGGIFLFFIFQGLGDLKGPRGEFNYGYAVRKAIMPLSDFFSLTDSEARKAAKFRPRLAAYGEGSSLPDSAPSADISDWMAGGDGGGRAVGAGGASSRPAGRTSVPRMGGGGGRLGPVGGGESNSSAEVSRFEGGGDAKAVRLAGGAQGGRSGAQLRSGTLRALNNARTALGDGLTSGSAVGAKSKWDQSFNSATTDRHGVQLAYGGPGLSRLDRIKSGEVDNLKMMDPGSLKVADPGPPARDGDAESKDPVVRKVKEEAKESAEKEAAKAMADGVGGALRRGDPGGRGGPGGSDASGSPGDPEAAGDGAGAYAPPASGNCDLSLGPPEPICAAALGSGVRSDTSARFSQVGSTSEGRIYEVVFEGVGPGITEAAKDKNVSYQDKGTILVRPDGTTEILSPCVAHEIWSD